MPVVVSDGALALIAGSDTTMTVLSALFWGVLSHSKVYNRLREEVDKFYPPGEDSTSAEHHPQMVYLEAVMYVLHPYDSRPRIDVSSLQK